MDLSTLSDEALIEVARRVEEEAARRSERVRVTVEGIALSAREKLQIARAAAERETALLRAKERERVANEARERVRQEAEAARAAEEKARAEQRAKERLSRARQEREEELNWLKRVAEILGVSYKDICLWEIPEYRDSGTRIVVNRAGDGRYAKEHLVDYATRTLKIRTKREYVSRKAELARLLESWWQSNWAAYRAAGGEKGTRDFVGIEP